MHSINKVELAEVDELFDLFSKLILSQFPEYTQRVRKHLITSNRTYNKDFITKKIEEEHIVLCAKVNGKIVGIFIADRPLGGASFGYWLMVDPAFQRKGIGRDLLKTWEEIAKNSGAHNLRLESDKANVEYYKKMGFKLIGLDEKGYFGSDNYIFAKIIQEPNEENIIRG